MKKLRDKKLQKLYEEMVDDEVGGYSDTGKMFSLILMLHSRLCDAEEEIERLKTIVDFRNKQISEIYPRVTKADFDKLKKIEDEIVKITEKYK